MSKSEDRFAVAVYKAEEVVGHVPHQTSLYVHHSLDEVAVWFKVAGILPVI